MMALWRNELQELAAIESTKGGAVSFYYQPTKPQDKAHKSDAILIKELLREARRDLDRTGDSQHAREALDRIASLSEGLHLNGSRPKAVFGCLEHGVWREFDLPASVGGSRIVINSRFHLRPFVAAASRSPQGIVALIDREKARIFEMQMGELTRGEEIVDEVPRRVRTDGFGGYDAGHVERHVENEVRRHLKRVAERLQELVAQGKSEMLVVGCRAEIWPDLESQLHTYVKQALIGRFDADPATTTNSLLKDEAQRILQEHLENERQGLLREVIGEVQRDGFGSLGLRRVLTSLERGEVQTVLLGDNFNARAVECKNCGHLDTRMVANCAVCGQGTRELDNVADALIGYAVRRGADIVYVGTDPEFESRGSIGARLRFRADQNTSGRLAG